MEEVSAQKSALRKSIKDRLGRLSDEEIAERSSAACWLLARQGLWTRARSILFYAPLPGELDIWPLLERALAERKVAALPRYSPVEGAYEACRVQNTGKEVTVARFGIREPVESCAILELKRLDLVLVPGVAFDPAGNRVGRGKGYYDRLLSSFDGKTCGVAFDEQVVAHVPIEAHDVLLNFILTPTRWFEV